MKTLEVISLESKIDQLTASNELLTLMMDHYKKMYELKVKQHDELISSIENHHALTKNSIMHNV